MDKHEDQERCGCGHERRHHPEQGERRGHEHRHETSAPAFTCGCRDTLRGQCACGCHDHSRHVCNCGRHHEGRRHAFRRHFVTREERIARLQQYLDALRKEAQAVEEHIAAIQAKA